MMDVHSVVAVKEAERSAGAQSTALGKYLRILVVFAASTTLLSLPAVAEDKSIIEIRSVVECPPGVAPIQLPQAQGRCLGHEIIVAETDVLSADKQYDRITEQATLVLVLTPEAGARMNRYTRLNLGKQVAVVLAERPVAVPVLLDPDLASMIQVVGISEALIDQVIDRLRAPRRAI